MGRVKGRYSVLFESRPREKKVILGGCNTMHPLISYIFSPAFIFVLCLWWSFDEWIWLMVWSDSVRRSRTINWQFRLSLHRSLLSSVGLERLTVIVRLSSEGPLFDSERGDFLFATFRQPSWRKSCFWFCSRFHSLALSARHLVFECASCCVCVCVVRWKL